MADNSFFYHVFGLHWKKWSRLIERVWLILNLEEGGKDEPEEIHARTDYWDASGS